MLNVSEELKHRLKEANRELRRVYPSDVFEPKSIREQLTRMGRFSSVRKWTGQEMKAWLGSGSLVGVDGSVNSTPGAHPHVLSVFQALAKGTRGEEVWDADLYTPLLDGGESGEEGELAREAKHRGRLLAGLEIDVARETIRRWQPPVIMMDGSLLHFWIDHPEAWEVLAQEAQAANVLLIGVSEEIGTRSLARKLFPEQTACADREVLFGVLQPSEVYVSEALNPSGPALWKAVLRSSKSPQPVGVDGLLSQQESQADLLRLVHTLTPAQGRGIPLWLDIVDREVRVTDALVTALVEQYIDPDLRHRLLVPKRKDRVL
ncbi:DNA double-strand break repair nuclease NurA [Desmospora activa]|uniref:NurA domain-containing protein n=1 Tax=Desmospora activa DSM 45169 TaxID=1121389 RepID=A0A2T4Z237_9BACL|nr:DNA double-strand break repair nuclease NurA [Desmospora activa]PTM54839.1 NurA domain-containing protein [Desmospora activa DSM 45169]